MKRLLSLFVLALTTLSALHALADELHPELRDVTVKVDSDCSSWMNDWITEAQNLTREDNPRINYLAYVIEDKRTGLPIGSVGCSYYADMRKVGITYFIGADYRNEGYASEAIKAYVCYFFEHYDENEIIATIREDNFPSWKAIENAGFTLTEKKMYKDIYDVNEELYRFYSAKRMHWTPERQKGEKHELL